MPQKYSNEILEKAYELITKEGYSSAKASKELKIDNGTMRKRLKEKYGQILLPDGKKRVDSKFFNEINSEEKAYWLGFFTADGYVKGNTVELCLAEIDKEHMEKFKKSIKSHHKISIKKNKLNGKEFLSRRICIRDSELGYALNNLGLDNNKSNNAFIPISHIPSDMIRHYIRGLFDGDGSIYNGSNGENVSIVTKSEKMCTDFYNVIKENIDASMYKRKTRNLFELRLFSKKDVASFLNWIYKDTNIYLERKYNKYCRLESKLQEAQDD